MALFTCYFLFESVEVLLKEITLSEKTDLQQGAYSLNHHVNMTVSDLQFLANQDGLVELASGKALKGHDHVSKDWLVFSKAKSNYDQIRWLDSSGMERERVNYNNGNPIIVDKNKLQNKSKRYYFTDVVKLNRG